jgi:hypothetical protein
MRFWKTFAPFISLLFVLNSCKEDKTIAPAFAIEALIHHAEWVLNDNKESEDWLKRYHPILYHHAIVLKTGSTDSQKWLQINSPVLYHHADWIVNKNESSGEWLKKNDLPFYHHAVCLMTKSEDSKEWLRYAGWRTLHAQANWFMTGKKIQKGWRWRWHVGTVSFL